MKLHLPQSRADVADWLAAAVAFSLPWSTSATAILIVVWLLAVSFTLRFRDVCALAFTPAGGLPLLLVALGAVGTLWAHVAPGEMWGGFSGFVKLAAIPLLMAQFARSGGGRRVAIAFLSSCVMLLIASYASAIWPALPKKESGVPVKDYILQSVEFTICAAALLHFAYERMRACSWLAAIAFAALAAAFLLNVFFVVTGRTALATIPVLIVAYGGWRFGTRGVLTSLVAATVLAGSLWVMSSYVRQRVGDIWHETNAFETRNVITSSGDRILFWEKSIDFIAAAPLIGHGTGSIASLFRQAAIGQSGARAQLSTNPHNQTFAVAIQLGILGTVALWGMWFSQALQFRAVGDVEWIGLVVLVPNVVGSLFNSFIFDFTEGWLFVFGIGVTAGMVIRKAGYPGLPASRRSSTV